MPAASAAATVVELRRGRDDVGQPVTQQQQRCRLPGPARRLIRRRLGVISGGRIAARFLASRSSSAAGRSLGSSSALTPPVRQGHDAGGTGGSPAAVHSRSPQASTWAPSGPSGDHEARTSISADPGSSDIPPKLSDATRVTVPLGARKPASWLCRASSSQVQPTALSRGSVTISGSMSARA